MGDTDMLGDMELRSLTHIRLNEVYDRRTIQGEGPYAGRLCTFVRTYGCNLHCKWCDTPFTWDTTGRNGTVYPVDENLMVSRVVDVADAVIRMGVPICVVSGGEPLLQATAVVELARLLARYDIETHVETNGTRLPPPSPAIAHWSVSPKLLSADAGARALSEVALHAWAQHPLAIFKVVCSTPADVDHAAMIFAHYDVRREARWVMPEGRTRATVAASLAAIVGPALGHGLNISPRLHVDLWNDERGR